jgi:5-methylcytosine-specific restriction endonuclease McrA
MLAERFPKPDVPTRIEPLAHSPAPARVADPLAHSPAPARVVDSVVDSPAPARVADSVVDSPAPARVEESARATVAPLSAERYALQVSISREFREDLECFQELMGLSAGDVEAALGQALKIAVREVRRRKHAATDRPRAARASRDPRHIPAAIKRAVRARDGDRCTFVNDRGQRCTERKALEYDHVEPVARGGTATLSSIRLLCRTHNQLEAERVFGTAFVAGKRAVRGLDAKPTRAGAGGGG